VFAVVTRFYKVRNNCFADTHRRLHGIFMNKWLEDFAYRIHISMWVFALAAIIAISIAFITVSFQAIKAAVANPVKSLRTE
jgi:ABC-type antimicrobial peptide transport system permease subunit